MRALTLRRRFYPPTCWAVLVIALITNPVIEPPAHAQTTARRALVGTLGSTPTPPALYEIIKQSLVPLGYTEGQQVAFVQQHADGEPARLPAAAEELVRTRPDVPRPRGLASRETQKTWR